MQQGSESRGCICNSSPPSREYYFTNPILLYYWLLLLFASVGISDITACWLQISKNWPVFVLVLVSSMEKHVLDRLMLEQ